MLRVTESSSSHREINLARDEALNLHLGSRLRRRRRLLGYTQDELAARLGVRFQQIQKYESAVNRMSATRLWELAEALNVPVNYFYEGFETASDRLAA